MLKLLASFVLTALLTVACSKIDTKVNSDTVPQTPAPKPELVISSPDFAFVEKFDSEDSPSYGNLLAALRRSHFTRAAQEIETVCMVYSGGIRMYQAVGLRFLRKPDEKKNPEFTLLGSKIFMREQYDGNALWALAGLRTQSYTSKKSSIDLTKQGPLKIDEKIVGYSDNKSFAIYDRHILKIETDGISAELLEIQVDDVNTDEVVNHIRSECSAIAKQYIQKSPPLRIPSPYAPSAK
jgi:hypothetical protein